MMAGIDKNSERLVYEFTALVQKNTSSSAIKMCKIYHL